MYLSKLLLFTNGRKILHCWGHNIILFMDLGYQTKTIGRKKQKRKELGLVF